VIVNQAVLIAASSSMSASATRVQHGLIVFAADSVMTVDGNIKWIVNPDTPETWNAIADTAETWTPISDTDETWSAIADTSENWTPIADNAETWQIAA
jgi:hypothetical protein